MNMRYYEKLMIAIILFIGVVIFTSYTIGVFASTKKAPKQNTPNQIILD